MAGAASGSSSSSSGGGGGGGGGSNAGTGSNINAAGGVHAGEQQYSLRWNDFHSSILSSFRHLRDEEDFVDVTLACDSNSFTAHKVVLSACSPYFRELLKANPCQHPIVILRDVASADMESLLRFMYHGEVHVGQEQLAAFLKTAQMLQVRGLADVNSGAAASKLPSSGTPLMGSHHISSSPATPRNPWQDNGRDLNDSGMSPPPEKRPRSYSPPRSNHIEAKSDLQESLLGQALEGGPTIHTPSSNNLQAQSTGEDSNSMSDNEEDTSNNDSMLNSVKTEPSDLLNDSLEHHRNAFPILSLQGLMPGPSGIHAANQDPNYDNSGLGDERAEPVAYHHHHQQLRAHHPHQQHYQQQQQHHHRQAFRCPLCTRVIQDITEMRHHLDQHYPRDSPTCPVTSCAKSFSHPNSVRNHMRLKHPVQWEQIKTLRWTYV